MKFTGKQLVVALKWLGLIVVPALGILYFALSKIWGLPFGAEIPATTEAVVIFFGAIIGVSKSNDELAEKELK